MLQRAVKWLIDGQVCEIKISRYFMRTSGYFMRISGYFTKKEIFHASHCPLGLKVSAINLRKVRKYKIFSMSSIQVLYCLILFHCVK